MGPVQGWGALYRPYTAHIALYRPCTGLGTRIWGWGPGSGAPGPGLGTPKMGHIWGHIWTPFWTPFWAKYVDTGSGPGRGRPKKGSKRGQKGVQNDPLFGPYLDPLFEPSWPVPLCNGPITWAIARDMAHVPANRGSEPLSEWPKKGSKKGHFRGYFDPFLGQNRAIFGPLFGPHPGCYRLYLGPKGPSKWPPNMAQKGGHFGPLK
jgi:hypothetical protein